MSENTETIRKRRISSILKNVGANGDSPTQTFSRRSKRISFSRVNNVKEFAADGENRTIWGESYEKRESVPSVVSASSELCNTNVTCASGLLSVNSTAVTPQIDLFADIEDEEVSSQSPTKFLNQSMFIDEEINCDDMATATVTISKSTEMSITNHTIKRKSNETDSVDQAVVEMTKSVKIRKMNEEIMEITFAPESQDRNTILQTITMGSTSLTKQDVDLNTTRLYDIDVSDVDDLSNCQTNSRPSPLKATCPETVTSNIFEKTTISSADMTLDDRTMFYTDSDVFHPMINKTQYYGPGNISSGVDQTLSVQNPMQENNFIDQQIFNENVNSVENKLHSNVNRTQYYGRDDISDGIDQTLPERIPLQENIFPEQKIFDGSDSAGEHVFHPNVNETQLYGRDDISDGVDQTIPVRMPLQENNFTEPKIFEENDPPENHSNMTGSNKSESDIPVFQSKFAHREPRVLDDISISMDMKFKHVIDVPASHSIFGNTDEHGIEDLTISMDMNFKAEVSDGNEMPSDSANDSNNEQNRLPESSQLPQNHIDTPSPVPDSSGNQFLPMADFSFGNSEPFSSTRVAPISNLTLNFTNNDVMKATSSNVTFNECPTLITRQSRDLRSGMSSQNNTDELCNLEPDQLRKLSEMKKIFLDISNTMPRDMLSETKFELIDDSIHEEFATNDSLREKFPPKESLTMECKAKEVIKEEPPSDDLSKQKFVTMEMKGEDLAVGGSFFACTTVKKEINVSRCLKCSNCRKSLDAKNFSMLKMEDLQELQLDMNGYNQFKGYASFKDVIEAHKKRIAAKELEEQSLIDQNVEAPDVRFLWENYIKSTTEPYPVFSPEPLICHPMRMSIQFLMKNKLRTEYTNWKYFDNYFQIGAIALRHEKIPSIRIHIKFDENGLAKAEQLNMPLLFKRVFVEECPVYLKNISPRNYLKHKHALALLPLNLTTILSDSDNIYKGLDEINLWFGNTVMKINEMELLTAEYEVFLKMEEKQCYIEKALFDPRKYVMQEFFIKLDKIDNVGPRNVIFQPTCETTNEFKNLPIGLPFLRTFLSNPKSYLMPFLDG